MRFKTSNIFKWLFRVFNDVTDTLEYSLTYILFIRQLQRHTHTHILVLYAVKQNQIKIELHIDAAETLQD